MFTKAILPDTLRALQLISKVPVISNAYLAGGSALALWLGHRISVDLDFFTQEEFDADELSTELLQYNAFHQDRKAWRTVMGKVGKTKFSLFYYKYRLLEEPTNLSGIRIASKKDIAAMKINALEDRGTRRDFIDVFFLAKEFSIEKMLSFYDQKYKVLKDHLYSIVRALNYFEDAEREAATPKMLVDVSWDEVKKFFREESLRLAKEKLGV